jgi:tetratricopeptide (TPR) repeat protein
MHSTRRFQVVLAAGLVLSASHPTAGTSQERRLGRIDFPTSGTPEAQTAFVRGVLLLHSFEYEDAATAFREAQRRDPDFAMAYWGEAMTYNHPLWRQQDRDAALATLARFAPTPGERAARAPTERERGYLEAVDALYGPGDKGERDRAYMEAMGRLAARFPDDLEARAFHALSILGSRDGERDFATYMRAAAEAAPVFDANPEHPGAPHYMIHSFDDPVHAPLGLEAARAYSGIAPDAGHAQHMTSHIFIALGMWDDVVAANVRARDVQNKREAELGRPPNVCGHYTSWLHYGWLQQGRLRDADRGMADCLERVRKGGTASEQGYFAAMRARHVLDTEDWNAADRLTAELQAPAAQLVYAFVTAYAALKRGDVAGAQRALEAHEAAGSALAHPDPRAHIQEMELAALRAVSSGDTEDAVESLREATALEESLPFEFGPPASVKPPHELLGEVLLEAGRPTEALAAFEASLARTPLRVRSLQGLAAAAGAAGDRAKADEARASVLRIQHGGDSSR